jgi:phosphoglycerol transferase MdoB-like AlkP superfamily enzyme
MAVETAFVSVPGVSLVGLALSVAIECLMVPRPLLARPWAAWALHAGLWMSAYAALTLVLGRPWFAAAAVLAFLLMLVQVNNAKMKALREPFVFQDYEYFTDAIRYPRLYIPFLGWLKFLGAAVGFVLAIVIGLWWEETPTQRFTLPGQLGGIAVVFVCALLCLLVGNRNRKSLTASFNPERDTRTLGLLASCWCYGKEERMPLAATSPFGVSAFHVLKYPEKNLPHLVAVQSESFFDPRPLYPGIRPDVLAEFDRLKGASVAHGKLVVPAWGSNTVRTEFAFLSGISADKLGVHRFNPYRAIAAGWNVLSLASHLKNLGYRTVCIHPHPAGFYRRDRVFPRLDFDVFLDVRAFGGAMRFGPYIGDSAVADQIEAVLLEARVPTFIFAITMENHGPLHLERTGPSDIDDLYTRPPPRGCDDLTIYLRHLRNADRMASRLRLTLEQCEHPASLCWYGDHVPIMPSVYEIFGAPQDVEYVCWSKQWAGAPEERKIHVHDLALDWLRFAGVDGALGVAPI